MVNRTHFINGRVKICANCSEIKHEVAVKQEMMESGAAVAGDQELHGEAPLDGSSRFGAIQPRR